MKHTRIKHKPTLLSMAVPVLLLSLSFLIAPLKATSQLDSFIIEKCTSSYDLKPYLYHLKSMPQGVEIQELVQNKKLEWQSYSDQSKYDLKKEHWFKLEMASANYKCRYLNDWYLLIGNPEFTEVYITDSEGEVIESHISGSWVAVDQKSVRSEHDIERVNLSLDLSNAVSLWIRWQKKDGHPHSFNFILQDQDIYTRSNSIESLRKDWIFLGFLLTMFMVSVILFFLLKEISLLYHAGFILGASMLLLDHFNIVTFLYPINVFPQLTQAFNVISVIILSEFYLLFLINYADTKRRFPFWHKMLGTLVRMIPIILGLTIIYYYLSYNEPLADKIISAFLIGFCLLMIAFTIDLFRKRDLKLNFIIAGNIFLFGAIILNGLSFLMDNGIWSIMSMIGVSGEIICFSLGLAFKFKELQEEREQTRQKQALEAFKAKIFTNITHEFKTPLTVVKAVTETIREHTGSIQQNVLKKYLYTIQKNSDELLNLVTQLLDLSKIERKKLDVNTRVFRIGDFLEECKALYEDLADKENVHMEYELSHANKYIETDFEKLKRIVGNLISNAIKFTPPGGLVNLKIRLEDHSSTVLHVEVTDNGKGIPKEEHDKIFERFHQLDSNGDPAQGTGIGLSLVKDLTELLGGKLELESTEQSGSRFSVKIPVNPGHAPELVREKESLSHSRNGVDSNGYKDTLEQKILIVKGNSDLRNFLYSLLQKDYFTIRGEDGLDGLEKCTEMMPDIVISDVMMPKMNGYELCSRIKTNRLTSHIPVILLTAKSEVSDRIHGLECGADAYLQKPFSKKEFLTNLNMLIESRKSLQEKFMNFSQIQKPESLNKENSFLNELHRVIEENTDNYDFSIEYMASELHISRMQLHRKIKSLTGKSASSYVRSYRLNKARKIICDPSLSISEVAWQVGFHDSSYFSKCFATEFGMSPTEYRENHLL